MKRWVNKALALTAVSAMVFSTSIGANASLPKTDSRNSANVQTQYVEGEAIILYNATNANVKQFKDGTTIFGDAKIAETYDFDSAVGTVQASGTNAKNNNTGFKVSLVKSNKYSTAELVAKLKAERGIRYAEPNYKVHAMLTDDAYSKYQWSLDNQGQNSGTAGLDVNADTLNSSEDTEEKVIAVVDTGINYEHEDLADIAWNNPVRSKTFKGLHGYDFVNLDEDPMDDNGHGSHCSGIMAAATNNKIGISGVATSDNIKVMGLKVLDADGYGDNFAIVGAYNYIYKAQMEGINVVAINNSWGGEGDASDEILAEMINLVGENGAISVCAAGNESSDNDSTYVAPAGIDSPYVLSVAASNEKDELAAFSNYGTNSVDLAAPGTDILSTVASDTFNPSIYGDKNALCQVFESFDGVTPVQVMDRNGYINDEQDEADEENTEDEEDEVSNTVNADPDEESKTQNTEDADSNTIDVDPDEENETQNTEDADSNTIDVDPDEENEVQNTEDTEDADPDAKNEVQNTTADDQSAETTDLDATDETEPADGNTFEYGLNDYGCNGESAVEIVSDTFFGVKKEQNASLKWTITGAESGDIYALYIPYKPLQSATPLYSSVMVKAQGAEGEGDFFGLGFSTLVVMDSVVDDNGIYNEDNESILSGIYVNENQNYWSHLSEQATSSVRKEQTRAIKLLLTVGEGADGDFVVYVDDVGVSKENVKSEEFGMYDFYNGTSMATPHVTGAMAAVAARYPDEDALEWKARIIGSVRKSESLTDYTASGGVLDLSNVDSPRFSLESLYAEDGILYVNGHYLEGAQVSINGKTVQPLDVSASSILLDVSKYENTLISLVFVKGDETISRDYFVAAGQAYNYEALGALTIQDGGVVSDGETVYYINKNGNIYSSAMESELYRQQWDVDDNDDDVSGIVEFDKDYNEYFPGLFGEEYSRLLDYSIDTVTDFVYLNHRIYTVLRLDAGYSEKTVLVSYHIGDGWNTVADVPDALSDLVGYTLAAYNGNLYIMGGLNTNNGSAVRPIYQYEIDSEKGEWKKLKTQLPEGRCFAKAIQIDNRLLITLGSDGTDAGVPANLIYDGKTFKVSKTNIGTAYEINQYLYENDEGELLATDYYNASIGLVKNGVVYVGLDVEKLGDTFIYDANTDKYRSAGYSLGKSELWGDTVFAATADNKLYIINGDNYIEDFDDWEIWKNSKQNAVQQIGKQNLTNDFFAGSYDDEWNEDLVIISSMDIERGTIAVQDKSTEGAYVIGAGYYLPGTDIRLTAEAEDGYELTGFTVNGQKVTGTEWNQVMTTSGATIVATAQAKLPNDPDDPFGDDPSGDDWNNYPEIPDDPTSQTPGTGTSKKGVKKGDVVSKGNLKYKVTKTTASKKTVTCIGPTNKNVKKVTIPNTIKIKGAKYKVTAIGNNAFKNCKKLKYVTVNKNLTKVGKNIFKGCKKLKKITCKSTKSKIVKSIKKQVKKSKVTVKRTK